MTEGVPVSEQAVLDRMLAAHFSNNGLQHLVGEAGQAMGNHIVVVDPGFRDIAHFAEVRDDDQSPYAQAIRAQIEEGVVPAEGIEYIREKSLDELVGRVGKAHVVHNEHLGVDVMLGASMAHGICLAHVMMVAYDKPFVPSDEENFVHLVNLIGQELQKTSLYTFNRGQAKSHFLIDLLKNHQPNTELIEQRLKLIDFRPRDRFLLVVMKPRQIATSPVHMGAIAGQLQTALTGAIYAEYQGAFVILFTRNVDEQVSDRSEHLIRHSAKTNDLAVGVSNYFTDLTRVGVYYRQATSAIRRGEIAAPTISDDSVYLYRDYAYMEMLDVCREQADLMDYVQPCLLDLFAYDRDHGSELMDTLFAFLQNGCNTQRTAASLNIHKNTLLYRMSRVREILGCSLESGEDIFKLQLSFRVLMHLGQFYSRISLCRHELAGSVPSPSPKA